MIRRMVGAWQVLMGQRLVPFQIQSEWVIYQQTFQAQLEQMSSYLARAAKAEKKRLERISEQLIEALPAVGAPPAAPIGDRDARKAELRARMATGLPGVHRARPQPLQEVS